MRVCIHSGNLGTVNYALREDIEKVLAITGGRGVDVSFDQLGGDALIKSLDMLAPLGLVVLYNALVGAPSEDPVCCFARTAWPQLGRSVFLAPLL